ncbi:MAG: tetratricopeptide repeat protein [Deltaproteobacteria bacterium]|nr:tetratricopeptide repeat protein [Deltaproteobacteria bacterium]
MTAKVSFAQAGIPYLVKPKKESPDISSQQKPSVIPAPNNITDDTIEAPSHILPPAKTNKTLTPEPNQGKSPSFFADLWSRRRAALSRGDYREATRILVSIINAKNASGWPDFFTYGIALVQEAKRSLASGQPNKAINIAKGATLLAPHLPATHFIYGQAAWASSEGSFTDVITSYLQGLYITISEPPLIRIHLGNFFLSLSTAILLVAGVLTIISLYRYSRLFFHDLQHILPRSAFRIHRVLLGLLLLLAPILLRLGILWVIVIWLSLFSIYYEVRERVGVVVLLAAIAGVAFLLPWLISHLNYADSRSQDVYLTVRDIGAEAAANRVRLLKNVGPDELYALGLRAKWSGEIAEACGWLDRAATAIADEDLWVTTGNARCLSGDRQGAIVAYKKALQLNSENLAAWFNLSRVYYAMTEHQKAGEAQRQAMSLDLERVEKLADQAKRASGIFLVEANVPRRLLAMSFESGPEHYQAVAQIWQYLGGKTKRLAFGVAALAGCCIVLILGIMRQILRPAKLCPRCGMAACHHCHHELPDQRQCGQCYYVFVALEHVDPRQCIRKEIQVHRYRDRQTRIRQFLSVLLAGCGQILRGAFPFGIALMVGYLTFAILLLQAFGFLPTIVTADGGPYWFWIGLALLAMIAIYVFALIDGLREDR